MERQYSRHFEVYLTEKLREETKSARLHNTDAKKIMGMFSAVKRKALNATLCYLSCKMRSKKNRSVDYLDGLSEDTRESILKVIQLGQSQKEEKSDAEGPE